MVAAAQNAGTRSGQSGPLLGTRKSSSITPGNITTLATVAVSVTVAGVKIGDGLSVSFNSALVAGIIAGQPYCDTDGTVKIPFSNITAGTVNQTAVTANIRVNKAP